MSDIMTKPAGWQKPWDPAVRFVTNPSPQIADSHEQQKARLTAGITFVAAVLGTLTLLVAARDSSVGDSRWRGWDQSWRLATPPIS